MLFGRNLTSINPFQGLRIRLFPLGFSTKSDRDDEFYENSDFVVLLTVFRRILPTVFTFRFPDFVVLPIVLDEILSQMIISWLANSSVFHWF